MSRSEALGALPGLLLLDDLVGNVGLSCTVRIPHALGIHRKFID